MAFWPDDDDEGGVRLEMTEPVIEPVPLAAEFTVKEKPVTMLIPHDKLAEIPIRKVVKAKVHKHIGKKKHKR